MKLFIAVILTAWGCFAPGFSEAQVKKSSLILCNEVKDSVIARYNRSDFNGIYQLADTSFTKTITRSQLVNFLAGNFSTGRILKTTLVKDSTDGKQYLLEGQARNTVLIIDVNEVGKFSTFGFRPYPIQLRPVATSIKSNNKKRTKLDLKIDSIAREYFRFPYACALSIGIIKNGKMINYQYGETKKGNGILPDLQTRYQIASVTKTFTATMLAQAVLDGKLKLSDDIRKYLPGSYPNLEFNGQPITLVNLANHTARLPAIPNDLEQQPDFDPVNSFKNYSRKMFFESLKRVKMDSAPGSKFEYSNMGLDLIAFILEDVYNMSYDQLLAKVVTTPMGMKSTRHVLTPQDIAHAATPYSNNGNALPFWNTGAIAGAGGVTSNTKDMLQYLQNQINENLESVKLTHVPTANSTGLGWGVRTVNGIRDLQHNGGAPGSRSNVTFYPELNTGCVIMVNNDSDNNIMNSLVWSIQQVIKAG